MRRDIIMLYGMDDYFGCIIYPCMAVVLNNLPKLVDDDC